MLLGRSKSPLPPKPSKAKLEYLRRVLADVPPSSSADNPFTAFRLPGISISRVESPGILLARLGGGNTSGCAQSVEECVRMFTVVEALDGNNMVGCRICWKTANRLYSNSSTAVNSSQGTERNSTNAPGDSEDDSEDDNMAAPIMSKKIFMLMIH
jgi:ubiquitin carboxyl-terminal hydrolase 16/45